MGASDAQAYAACGAFSTLNSMYNAAMTRDANTLLKEALALSVPERAKDKSMRAAWDDEIARRMKELDSRRVKAVSLVVARRRLLRVAE
jgi:hypothetical protein